MGSTLNCLATKGVTKYNVAPGSNNSSTLILNTCKILVTTFGDPYRSLRDWRAYKWFILRASGVRITCLFLLILPPWTFNIGKSLLIWQLFPQPKKLFVPTSHLPSFFLQQFSQLVHWTSEQPCLPPCVLVLDTLPLLTLGALEVPWLENIFLNLWLSWISSLLLEEPPSFNLALVSSLLFFLRLVS